MILLKNGTVYGPTYLGQTDLLIAGSRIARLSSGLNIPSASLDETINLEGKWVFPGLIDSHVHFAGAGGEGGTITRTEGIGAEQLYHAGITTVVGCLGTDGFTRSVESVLMKTKKLRAKGLSAWMYTGSYQVPPPTLTGSISRDIALFEEIIGVGEIALADHRSSMPTLHDFISVLQQARLGGMIGGKCGITNIHIGDYGEPFAYLEQAIQIPGIYPDQMLPTHCNRTRSVFDCSKRYATRGNIDLTTSSYPYFPDSEIKPSAAFQELLNDGISADVITLSSDAGGSLPRFDRKGCFIGMDEGDPVSLFNELIDMIQLNPIDPAWVEKALSTVTRNVATRLKLNGIGCIMEGCRADMLVLDQGMNLTMLFCNGIIKMRDGRLQEKPTVSIEE